MQSNFFSLSTNPAQSANPAREPAAADLLSPSPLSSRGSAIDEERDDKDTKESSLERGSSLRLSSLRDLRDSSSSKRLRTAENTSASIGGENSTSNDNTPLDSQSLTEASPLCFLTTPPLAPSVSNKSRKHGCFSFKYSQKNAWTTYEELYSKLVTDVNEAKNQYIKHIQLNTQEYNQINQMTQGFINQLYKELNFAVIQKTYMQSLAALYGRLAYAYENQTNTNDLHLQIAKTHEQRAESDSKMKSETIHKESLNLLNCHLVDEKHPSLLDPTTLNSFAQKYKTRAEKQLPNLFKRLDQYHLLDPLHPACFFSRSRQNPTENHRTHLQLEQ